MREWRNWLLGSALLILIGAVCAQTLTLPSTLPAGTYTLTPTTAPPPPVIPPPPAPGAVSWVYHNGTFSWLGDYSWNGSVNYQDTTGVPMDGNADIAFTVTGQWGGWQPYDIPSGSATGGFDTSKWTFLHYCTKPTVTGQSHGTGISANNDAADGTPIQVVAGPGTTKYGPVPVPGVWGCYDIPLKDFGLTNPLILKFNITDGTGLKTNKFYIDDVGFHN